MLLHLKDLEIVSAEFEIQEKKKVLIIDDDEDILNWFRMIEKKDTPYNFYFLQDEIDILNVLEELKPDLIFFDLTQHPISNLSTKGDIPVVYMSTKETGVSESEQQSFMRKPLERRAVDAKIRNLLKIY